VATGTVKWFNPTKGYGFIQPSGGGGRDVFVHISAVEQAGLGSLSEGQTVEYEIESNRGKESAVRSSGKHPEPITSFLAAPTAHRLLSAVLPPSVSAMIASAEAVPSLKRSRASAGLSAAPVNRKRLVPGDSKGMVVIVVAAGVPSASRNSRTASAATLSGGHQTSMS
jgi:cold shock protein